MNAEFFRFVAVGGLAALVNWASRLAMAATIPLEVAVALAYLLGMGTAYVLARLLVFQDSGRHPADEIWRFAVVNAIALAQVWLVTVALARLLFPMLGVVRHADAIAHAVGVASPVFTSYVGHKHLTFRRRGS